MPENRSCQAKSSEHVCCSSCSIYATAYLGMAYGWPLVQCQLLISALWSIFYYQEITDKFSIAVFGGSCFVVLLGVIVLGKYGMGG